MSPVYLRASDDDRERVIDELRRHAGEGRLSVEELEERIERALAACPTMCRSRRRRPRRAPARGLSWVSSWRSWRS